VLVFRGQNILDDGHEQLRLVVSIEGSDNDAPKRVELELIGPALEGLADWEAPSAPSERARQRETTYRRSCVVACSATSSATKEKHGSIEVDAMTELVPFRRAQACLCVRCRGGDGRSDGEPT
jgi:hypothetical protein